ncbi:hypothetical protein [Photobacterium rosenbergii]|nr:hypothetical protein [Photobacterium rosenbergii]
MPLTYHCFLKPVNSAFAIGWDIVRYWLDEPVVESAATTGSV